MNPWKALDSDPPVFAWRVLGLKACVTTPSKVRPLKTKILTGWAWWHAPLIPTLGQGRGRWINRAKE